jgi:hypothetical protein
MLPRNDNKWRDSHYRHDSSSEPSGLCFSPAGSGRFSDCTILLRRLRVLFVKLCFSPKCLETRSSSVFNVNHRECIRWRVLARCSITQGRGRNLLLCGLDATDNWSSSGQEADLPFTGLHAISQVGVPPGQIGVDSWRRMNNLQILVGQHIIVGIETDHMQDKFRPRLW